MINEEQIQVLNNTSDLILSQMHEQERIVLSRPLDISVVFDKFTNPLYNKIFIALQQGNFQLIGNLHLKELSILILEIIYCKIRNINIDIKSRFIYWENWAIQHKFPVLTDKE